MVGSSFQTYREASRIPIETINNLLSTLNQKSQKVRVGGSERR
jgi:hypothetical protein